MSPTTIARSIRTLELAHTFLEEYRREVERVVRDGGGLLPRVRSVHERPGHATPEYRTIAIPVPEGLGGASPEVLSGALAGHFRARAPSSLLLALDAATEGDGGEPQSVLIAEARDRSGVRLFYVQPFRSEGGTVHWEEPLGGGWRDPGGEEMILDAVFTEAAPTGR